MKVKIDKCFKFKNDFKIKFKKIKKKISHSNFKSFFPSRKNTIKEYYMN